MAPSAFRTGAASDAQVAQLVEHMTENHGVGGSIPPLGTITHPQPSSALLISAQIANLSGCSQPRRTRPMPFERGFF
jgi:hypothetical protein